MVFDRETLDTLCALFARAMTKYLFSIAPYSGRNSPTRPETQRISGVHIAPSGEDPAEDCCP